MSLTAASSQSPAGEGRVVPTPTSPRALASDSSIMATPPPPGPAARHSARTMSAERVVPRFRPRLPVRLEDDHPGSSVACPGNAGVAPGVAGDGHRNALQRQYTPAPPASDAALEVGDDLCTPPSASIPWAISAARPPTLKRRHREHKAQQQGGEVQWMFQPAAADPTVYHPGSPSPASSFESWQLGAPVARSLSSAFAAVSSALKEPPAAACAEPGEEHDSAVVVTTKNIRTSGNNDPIEAIPVDDARLFSPLRSGTASSNCSSPAKPSQAFSPSPPPAKRMRRSLPRIADTARSLNFGASPAGSFLAAEPIIPYFAPAEADTVTRWETLFTQPLPSLETIRARAASALRTPRGGPPARPASSPAAGSPPAVTTSSTRVSGRTPQAVRRPHGINTSPVDQRSHRSASINKQTADRRGQPPLAGDRPQGAFFWTSPSKAASLASLQGTPEQSVRKTPLRHMR